MMYTNQFIDWQGKLLGRYRLLQLLGRGGMGEVWLGEDTQLRRRIAVKLLPVALANDTTYLQSFEREARAAAALEHPNILPVHDFGKQQIAEDRIVTYLIMPHIQGGSLRDRQHAVNGPLPPDEALHYLRQAAQAIDFAHSQQVVHRDIKAANMLLQQGWLFLADFGIAKLLNSMTQRGQTNAGAGTPEYMAPEQVQGKAELASDRYSLAVVAYQLCTGHFPFRGETPYAVMMKQITEMPTSPRQFNTAIPPGVEQAILWGLRKQPEERPPSCKAFVEAIERGLHPTNLRQADPEATLLAPWSKRQAENAQQSVQSVQSGSGAYPLQSTPLSSMQQEQQIPSFYGTQSPVGNVLTAPTVPETPRSPTYYGVPTTTQIPPTGATRRKVSRRGVLIGGGAASLALVGGAGIFTYLHFASSNNHVVARHVTTPTPTPAPGPRTLIKGAPVLSLTGHTKSVAALAWDASGRYLATGSEDTHIMQWDIAAALSKNVTGTQTIATPLRDWKIPVANSITFALDPNSLNWSSDGRTIAVVTNDSNIYLFHTDSSAGTPDIYQDSSQSNSSNNFFYTCITWSPKTNSFATSESSFVHTQLQANIWQAGKKTAPVQNFSYQDANTVNSLASIEVLGWSADGTELAGRTNFNAVILWDAKTGAIKQVLHLPDRPSPKDNNGIINNECMAWSPVDSNLLVASDIDVASVWDTQQNKLLLTLQLNEPVFKQDNLSYYVWGLSWAPNGKYIAMCYPKDPKVYIWDVQTTGPSASLGTTRTQLLSFPDRPLNTAAITDVAWSPDGRYIATSSADTTVIVWKVDAS